MAIIMSDWKPAATIETLKARAEMMARVRGFFAKYDIIEVETPLLCQHSVTDRYMSAFKVSGFNGDINGDSGYLQTSPEYSMKRLLAAGSGSIFQICKSFRKDDFGSRHNPEFTMLEWYCLDFDHHQLMAQVFELLVVMASSVGVEITLNKLSYRQAFIEFLNIDPFIIPTSELSILAAHKLGSLPEELERDDYLALLFEGCIEPKLGQQGDVAFVYDYPVSQAALARLDDSNPEVACRFEVYWKGVELANGFYELTDGELQKQRFEQDNQWRRNNHKAEVDIDPYLLSALSQGLPECSGVALGLDRLLMILLGFNNIQDVIAFPADRA